MIYYIKLTSDWLSFSSSLLVELCASGGEGGVCTIGLLLVGVDAVLVSVVSVIIGLWFVRVLFGVTVGSVSSVSEVVRVTNCVKRSLIRCIKKFCGLRPGVVVVGGSDGLVIRSDSSSLDGRESGPENMKIL